MDFDQILYTLQSLPPAELKPFIMGTAALAAAVLLALFIESRFFKRSGRVGSWFAVRLVSAIAAPLAFAAVVLPARATSGMEGLAVFYLLLVTAGPLIWFGSHWLAGRLVRPSLAAGESIALGMSGLAILALPGTAFFAIQAPLYAAARDIGLRKLPSPGSVPLVHTVQPPQRFNLPGAGLVYTQSLIAPPGVRLERAEQRQAGLWPEPGDAVTHPTWCTHGADIHLMWSAREEAPYLRLHWMGADGRRLKGEFTPDLAAAAQPQDFSIAFRHDGFDPVVPVPRSRVHFEMQPASGPGYTNTNVMQAGETLADNCLMRGYTRAGWKDEGMVRAVGIMFYLRQAEPLRAVISRP